MRARECRRLLPPYAEEFALGIVVAALTYVSLILGELVPKRLALTRPETIARLVTFLPSNLVRLDVDIAESLTWNLGSMEFQPMYSLTLYELR